MLKNDFSREVLADLLDMNPAKTNRNVGLNILYLIQESPYDIEFLLSEMCICVLYVSMHVYMYYCIVLYLIMHVHMYSIYVCMYCIVCKYACTYVFYVCMYACTYRSVGSHLNKVSILH
jgi:hypothetical protein